MVRSLISCIVMLNLILVCRIDEGQASLVQAFTSATGRDKDRCAVTKDLSLTSISML